MFCCTQPLRSTARYARGEVIEINDFLLGTMAGGAADCSLIGSQSWWFRLGGTRGCWLPWDWPQGISKPIPMWPSIFGFFGKVVEMRKKMSRLRSGFGSATWIDYAECMSWERRNRVGCHRFEGRLCDYQRETAKGLQHAERIILVDVAVSFKVLCLIRESFKIRFMT